MKSFTSRYPALFLVALLTGAGNGVALAAADEVPVDDSVTAFRNIEQSLNNGQLQQAESQLNNLKQRAAGDTRLEQYQRQLAENYLQQGQNALQQGDLHAATAALTHARGLLPQAPALTSGLDSAISSARASELANAEQARLAAQQAAAKAAAAKAEQARQLKLTAERQAAQKKAAAEQIVSVPVVAAAPVQPRAQLIKPEAASSAIAMPMLDNQDNDALRTLLDSVASDVVNFDCAVSIEVRQGKDFPWVGALLSARVKKLNPDFKLQLRQVLNPQQAPQLVLTPKHG